MMSWSSALGLAGLAATACGFQARAEASDSSDDNPDLGGQIWRGERPKPSTHRSSIALFFETLDKVGRSRSLAEHPKVVGPESPSERCSGRSPTVGWSSLGYRSLVLATGARELFLPFPGWTLPNVMGAGGHPGDGQVGPANRGKVGRGGPALARSCWPWRRLLKAKRGRGSRRSSSKPRSASATFRAVRPGSPGQNRASSETGDQPCGSRNRWGPVYADRLLAGRSRRGGIPPRFKRSRSPTVDRTMDLPEADYLACGFGLVPNLELPWYSGMSRSKTGSTRLWMNGSSRRVAGNLTAREKPPGSAVSTLALRGRQHRRSGRLQEACRGSRSQFLPRSVTGFDDLPDSLESSVSASEKS